MKRLFFVLTLIFLFFFGLNLWSQEDCKVLVPEIAGQYIGKCKKGLANGKGLAIGIDRYTGTFKKGYPNGIGTYTWSTGEVYNGQWMDGKRHGVGSYSYIEDGKLAVMEGIWEEDTYIGPEPERHQVLASTGINRYSFERQGEGNQVTIYIYLNGTNNSDLEDFTATSTSGTPFRSNNIIGFELITFPFTCKVSYYSWNRLHTSRNFTRFEFQIESPGRYQLNLHNN
jgi:hypothetical protein